MKYFLLGSFAAAVLLYGGFLVARASSRQALDALLADEPFVEAGKMRFSRVTEFHPAQFQPLLKDWFAGAGG